MLNKLLLSKTFILIFSYTLFLIKAIMGKEFLLSDNFIRMSMVLMPMIRIVISTDLPISYNNTS